MLSAIVVGGGLAGIATAIALSRSGHHVTVLEAREQFSELGAGIQVPPNATKILWDWELADKILDKASLPNVINYRSYRGGELLYGPTLMPDIEARYGYPYILIHRKDLLGALVDSARQLGVSLRVDMPVVSVDLSSCSVTTTHGETLTADLIVGADGERSRCRQAILGKPDTPSPTGSLVYRFTVESYRLWQDPELACLVDPPCYSCWFGPGAHALVYEMSGSGLVNVVLFRPDPIDGRVQLGPREADKVELGEYLADWDPVLRKLLDMTHTDVFFWTFLQFPKENRRWMDGESQRVVLVGDAAHSMVPCLAQGAAQAIEDAQFLGRLFPRSVSREDIPTRLTLFSERRQDRALAVRSMSVRAWEICEMINGPLQEQRDSILRKGQQSMALPIVGGSLELQDWLYNYDVDSCIREERESC